MKKDISVFLKHILDSIKLIEQYKEGLTENAFHMSTEKQDVMVRRLEIIGEATKNLPTEFKMKHQEVPWKEMADMRDKVSHHYFGIDYNIVWDTITNLLPELKKQIEKLLKLDENNL